MCTGEGIELYLPSARTCHEYCISDAVNFGW